MNSIIAKLLADPTSTTDATSERHLAVALGYPTTWRVRRRILAKYSRYTDRGDAENSVDPPAVHSRDSWVEDVIYAGNPDKGVDRWYNHEAAMVASLTSSNNNPYQFKGGQLTKMIAKFTKGDAVEVKYDRKWFASTIEKRKEFPEGFKYSVHYTADGSSQDLVSETSIRLAPASWKALELAATMGLPAEWEATRNGKKYVFTSPDGLTFRSKKAAMDHVRETMAEGEDPPWRTAGHELVGRRIIMEHSHTLSGKRSITVDQIGQITGWISETDTDRNGEPGYMSEDTNEPASLFHIDFEDSPGHPYFKYLVDSQDMEEDEVRKWLIEEEEVPPKKRARLQTYK